MADETTDQIGEASSRSKATVQVAVLIDGKQVNWPLNQLELLQRTFDHQTLRLTFSLDIEALTGPDSFSRISEYQNTIGKSVTVNIEPKDEYVESKEKLEWFGYITNVTLSNSAEVLNRIIIEAKSPTYLMDHHKVFKTYENMNFTDVLKNRLAKAGLDAGNVESFDSESREYQVQWNQTDWEFITTSYKTGACWIYWDGKKLCVKKAASKGDHSLTWQKHVGSAEIKMNVVQHETNFHAWDGKKKEELSASHSSTTSYTGLAAKAYNASREKLKGKSALAFDCHPVSAGEAQTIAKTRATAQLSQLVSCFVQANMPSVVVGDTIVLEGLGTSYQGKYFVTEVRHLIENGHDYHNLITAIPLEIANPRWHQKPRERSLDPIPALVTDINDPDSLGRVKVKFHVKDEDANANIESWWTRIASTNAGAGRGFYFLPEINDEVLVAFDHGDPDCTMIVGYLWNEKDAPPISNAHAGGKVNQRVIFSRTGHQIVLGDEGGKESIKILDKTGNNKMVIDSAKNTITINADQDYILEVKGNISLKAMGDFKLEANNVDIKANMAFKVKASTTADVKSDGMMTLSAMGTMNQDGAMINISGKGPVSVTGAPIKLN